MEERRVGLEEVVLHIEDEWRVAEEGPRCKPRVPQIASPRRGSVVTAATHSRALTYLLARFPTWRYICTHNRNAYFLRANLLPPFPPFSTRGRISLTNVIFVLCVSSRCNFDVSFYH